MFIQTEKTVTGRDRHGIGNGWHVAAHVSSSLCEGDSLTLNTLTYNAINIHGITLISLQSA